MGTRRALVAALLLTLVGCSSEPATPGQSPQPRRSEPSSPPPDPSAVAGQSPPAPSSQEPDVSYRARVQPITPVVRARMTSSHRAGCPLPLRDLRYLQMSYVGFDGEVREGEMVVAARHAEAVTRVFEQLFEARWPLRRMVLVDEYDGDDDRSMAANNTSGYNCRRVAGTDRWSDHAFGAAIDINPVQNPYVQGTSYVPEEGAAFVDVPRGRGAAARPGVITDGDVVVRAFARIGWEWGGYWASSKDYQHFSASGG